MNVVKFLDIAIASIFQKYPYATCMYEKMRYSGDHYLWITPESILRDPEFGEFAYALYDQYDSHGFEGELVLTSTDSFIKPKCPILYESHSFGAELRTSKVQGKKTTYSFEIQAGNRKKEKPIHFSIKTDSTKSSIEDLELIGNTENKTHDNFLSQAA